MCDCQERPGKRAAATDDLYVIRPIFRHRNAKNLARTVSCASAPIAAKLAAMRRGVKQTVRTNGVSRTLLNIAVLLAFTLQAFLVQTHLHNLPASFLPTSGVTASAPDTSKAPIDADKCFLCQEYLHGGTYLTPAAAAVLPPSAVVSLLPLELAPLFAAKPQSHNWMGRAPPRA